MKNEPAEINVFHNGVLLTFAPPASFGAIAVLLRQGRRLKSFIPDDKWRQIVSAPHPSRFKCAFCAQPVLAFYDPNKHNECIELCRCTALWCIDKEHLIKTSEQWGQWQSDYIKEMADPAPFKSLIDGHLTGMLDQLGSDWLSRHVGMPEGVLWHSDGSVSSGDASVSFVPGSSLLTVVDHNHVENNDKIVEVIRKMQRNGLEPPERIITSGWDDDYIWPQGADQSRICTLPYRCDFCHAWVKAAPLIWPAHDRYLVCLCHAIGFRNDIAHPVNYKEWRDLIVVSRAESLKHGAGTSN
jgi:hypothetical protein